MEIHEVYKLHVESFLSSPSEAIRTADLLLAIYLFSSITKKKIRRQQNQCLNHSKMVFSSPSKRDKSDEKV